MEEIYKEKITPTLELFEKGVKLYYNSRNWLFSRSLVIVSVILIIESIFLITLGISKNHLDPNGVLSLFLGILSLYLYFTRVKRISRKSLKFFNKKNSSSSYKIDKNGYTAINNNDNKVFLWKDFRKAVIMDDVILLYKNIFRVTFFFTESYSIDEFEQIKTWVRNSVKYNY